MRDQKQSSMKRSAIYSAFSAAQQQLLDDTNKITAQQQQQQEEEEKGGNGVSTPPPHMQNLNSPRTTGGSKKSVTFRNDASLEEVKKYETTPTNGKKKKKSHMFQNNISASAWAEQLERRSSRALIRAAGSWVDIHQRFDLWQKNWHRFVRESVQSQVARHECHRKENARRLHTRHGERIRGRNPIDARFATPKHCALLAQSADAFHVIVTELMKRGNLHSILHDHDNIVRETVADNGRLRFYKWPLIVPEGCPTSTLDRLQSSITI